MKRWVAFLALMLYFTATPHAAADKPFVMMTTEVYISAPDAGIAGEFKKVARLQGDVDGLSQLMFGLDMARTRGIPGDRVVLIDSNGGDVYVGNYMIDLLKEEQKVTGGRVVCVCMTRCHSMAFNLLTTCDVRLSSSPASDYLIHQVAVAPYSVQERLTWKKSKALSDEIRKVEEPIKMRNSQALGMTPEEYELKTETDWYAPVQELLARKYLHGLAKVIFREGR